MTLIVEAPPTYEPERRYVLGVVLSEWLGLDWELRPAPRDDVRVTMQGEDGARYLALPDGLFAVDSEQWLTEASLPESPVAWREAEGWRLPVLYGPRPLAPALLAQDGPAVRIGADVLGSCFFMLTRYEE